MSTVDAHPPPRIGLISRPYANAKLAQLLGG